MTASVAKELYNSPNGDRWTLSRDDSGRMVVIHQPNRASGGRASEVAVEVFLAENHQGPEHEALVRELKSLGVADADKSPLELSAEQTDRASRALGQAVARCWSRIPQEIQHDLFEAAVMSEGEIIRQQLAVYLHKKHERTLDAVQAKATPTPDSLGG